MQHNFNFYFKKFIYIQKYSLITYVLNKCFYFFNISFICTYNPFVYREVRFISMCLMLIYNFSRHDIVEMLLKLALNTNQSIKPCTLEDLCSFNEYTHCTHYKVLNVSSLLNSLYISGYSQLISFIRRIGILSSR